MGDLRYSMTADGDELQTKAYHSVKGATEWLVSLRRSADLEGFDPFSDGYTEYENGLVSVAEGLTTILLARIAEDDHDAALGTRNYSDDLLAEDLEFLLTAAEDGQFRGTPYLEAETTDAFTDGVSFCSSTLLIARELSAPVSEERIEAAFVRTVEWFLDNYVESENGVGWAWRGRTEMEQEDDYYPPQTYFTFSACVALADAVTEASDVIGDRTDEVRDLLPRVKEFLLYDYRVGDGWVEFEPTNDLSPDGYDELNPTPSLLSTCYTIWAVCYLVERIDGITLDDEERALLEDGLEFVLDLVDDNFDRVYAYSRQYQCHRDGNRYYEGTTPYTLLNTLLAYQETVGGKDDRIEELVGKLTAQVIETCWAGSERDPEAGFRHFESQQVDSERNVTVIYATEVAVESLLEFGISPPETASIETEISEALQDAEERIVEIVGQRREAPTEVDADSVDVDEVERLNRGHVERYESHLESLRRRFQDLWIDEISDRLTNMTMNNIQQVPDDPADIHGEAFLTLLLDECYFENDPDAFAERIEKFREDYAGFVMLPYREVLDELASLDDSAVADPIERKKRIDRVLEDLEDDITRGHEPKAIARDYNESLSD